MAIKVVNGTVVRVTTYGGAAMRKHGSDRQVHVDGERAALDACAHVPVVYAATVIRRRKGA